MQKSIIVRAMRVMTGEALTVLEGLVQIFFPFHLFCNIRQRRTPQIVDSMAAEAKPLFFCQEQPLGRSKMGGMANAAAPLLFDWLVFDLGVRDLLPDLGVAIEAEVRHLLLEQRTIAGGMRVVAVGTEIGFHRRMNHSCLLHLFGEILMTLQAKLANGIFQQ